MSYESMQQILVADHIKSSLNATIINKQTIEPYIWVKLPTELSKYLSLYQIDEVTNGVVSVDYTDYVQIEPCKPWIRFDSKMFNLTPGLHTYKLSFVNKFDGDTVSLYISYRLQDDCPDKPYIYMDRGE